MHLSQPEGHAVISVKCYGRKSIALRRAHGKATSLSALSSFCFSFPTFPSERQRATWSHIWVLLTLCLWVAQAVRQFRQNKVSLNQTTGMENGNESHRVLGLLTGFDYFVGSLCRLQFPTWCFHDNCVLIFRKTQFPSAAFTQLCIFWYVTVSPSSRLLPRIGCSGRMISPCSPRL